MLKRLSRLLKKPIKTPDYLLKSNIPVSEQEYKRIKDEHAIEREWYKDTQAFLTPAFIKKAVKQDRLSKVISDDNFHLIMRLRNPELETKYPPFLTPEAKKLLVEITEKWREEMNIAGLDKKICLAVTSLVRDQQYQNEIVASGKLALSDGPHMRGEAFDIDGCGYYHDDKPVNPRQAAKGAEFHKAFKDMGAELKRPEVLDYSQYQPKVHELLKQVLDDMQVAGKLHYLYEFPNTSNTVFHIARNPNYSKA